MLGRSIISAIFCSALMVVCFWMRSALASESYPPDIESKISLCFSPQDASQLEAAKLACSTLLTARVWDNQHLGRIYMMRGNAYDNTGDPVRAIDDFNEAVELDPTEAAVWYNRAVYFVAQKNDAKAKADYQRATELDSTFADGYLGLALLDIRQGDDKGALDALDAFIRLKPDSAQAYLQRSAVYGKLGNSDAAIADIKAAIRIDPSVAKQVQIDSEFLR